MGISTSASLVARLIDPDDGAAWDRFYELYSPLIIGFARKCGCSSDAAYDVLQETMVCLLRTLPRFSYDRDKGKFRSFLLKIADSRVKDAYRRRRRYEELGSESNLARLLRQLPDAPEDAAPWQVWDALWEQNLLVQALKIVKKRVNKGTFRSFEMYVLRELPIAEVAAELGIRPNTIYQHRNRVIKILRREIDRLKSEIGE